MATSDSPPRPAISDQIWDAKYRLKSNDATPVDVTLADTWRRVATAAATAEKAGEQAHWAEQFRRVLDDLTFLPAGRIIAGAGTGRTVTLFNCFVMGTIEDDLGSIFSNLREAALTMQQGGGIGHDFSTLRPNGALVRSVGAGASGPVSFMDVWDAMCRTIMSAGQRRGAMMGTMRCDHPDIETFIAAKSDPHRLRNFNLSVLVTDAFMTAVRDDKDWDLVFEGRVYRTLRARDLWSKIMHATYAWAEPGVIFIDRINAMNNLAYAEEIHATNPCGEQPLPAYGACLLGSINLARLVVRPFEADAALDEGRLEALVPIAVRFLDDVIDVSHYPLEAQRQEALAKRRIGLGVTGLADALAMCGVRYGSPQAERLAGHWMARIERAAYLASAELAREKGPFPRFQAAPFLAAPNVARLPAEVRAAIARHGIRNGCLTSIAPTGTISLLAGNVSSGIEPVFDLRYLRRVRDGEHTREEWVEDYAHALFRHLHGSQAPLPLAFVTAAELTPMQHLRMQAALQAHVDSSISKTINCPENLAFDAFEDVYTQAYDLGLKGCTTFRPNPITGSVLETKSAPPTAVTASVGAASVALTPEAAPPPPPPPSRAEPVRAVASRSVDPRSADPRSADPRPADRGSGIVYMTAPLEREPVLSGYTYKLKWAGSDHALYITLNDIEQDGRRRPFEIFINTRNLEHYAWTVALTRMISAVFRRGGDVSFVVDELKAVFDPQGGQWMDGRYVPSLLAAIGEIIERHMRRTGFLQPRETEPGLVAPRERVADADHALRDRERDAGHTGPRRPTLRDALPAGARLCPRCSVGALVHESGCRVCRDCGYSSCG
jgi:ribonucleoside-diphosphate reductase alpha chain